jgi:hypothetical protein
MLMNTFSRPAKRIALLLLLGMVLPAAAQTGGMQNGPFDGMSSDIVVPAAVRVDGKNGAFFQTDLWIRCRTVPVAATLYFYTADAASATPAVTIPMTLTQPIVYLPDVLSATFGVPKGAGNIRIVAGAPVSAVVRVYNNGGGGAYGLSFMGMPSTMSLQSMPMMSGSFGMDDFAMYMLGLLPEPGNRVNVSVVNTNPTTVNGVVEVLDSDGSAPLGAGTTSLPFQISGYSSHQFNDVLANIRSRFGSGDTGLQVRVRLNQGSAGMVMAYAAVNDNTTNDGYVVMGNMMNGGRGMGMMP